MTTDPSRQPEGIPTGGQFAKTAHAEPGISLQITSQRDQLRADLAEAVEKHAALEHSEWAKSVWEKYPHASFAEVHLEGDGNEGPFTAGIDLYDPEGIQIAVDGFDEAILEEKWDTSWNVSAHAEDERVEAVMPPYSNAFSLDSIKERWTKMSSSPEPIKDPFAHLTGMDKARAQATYARKLNEEAVAEYVEVLISSVLAERPDAGRINVSRKVDVEYGHSFTLESVTNEAGEVLDVDLSAIQDEDFQDIYLDPYTDYDETEDQLYIELDPTK